jgi:hypothetical protein
MTRPVQGQAPRSDPRDLRGSDEIGRLPRFRSERRECALGSGSRLITLRAANVVRLAGPGAGTAMTGSADRWIWWTTTRCVTLLALIAGTVCYMHSPFGGELAGVSWPGTARVKYASWGSGAISRRLAEAGR